MGYKSSVERCAAPTRCADEIRKSKTCGFCVFTQRLENRPHVRQHALQHSYINSSTEVQFDSSTEVQFWGYLTERCVPPFK